MTNAIERDYNLEEVADAMQMSTRWVRQRVADGAEHMRYGRKIMFTAEQVAKLRAAQTKSPVPQSITTGKRRRAS